ncbi:MAG: hypothetical protein ACJAZO_003296 [Myxococcota bacterium]|jgi:hypothetical protein
MPHQTLIAVVALLSVSSVSSVSSAWAAPALVTTTRGTVELVQQGQSTPAPPPPFILEEGATLTLGDEALVVVLFEGSATQLHGPRDVDQSDLKTREAAPATRTSTLESLLATRTLTSRAGASRAGGSQMHLTRPIPGAQVVAIPYIAWRCDACPPTQVSIYDLRNDVDLWTGEGASYVPYDGPPLTPGAYLLALGDREHAFTVVATEDSQRLASLVQAASEASDELVGVGADIAARTSIVAAVYLQSGFPSEALYTIDNALAQHPADSALQALRASFELRAGLQP